MSTAADVLIIGAGLAGLVTAWQTTTHGKRSRVIAKGWGATHWHSGCVDVLGYYPLSSEVAVESPAEGIARLVQENPGHPYAIGGPDGLDQALRAFQSLCAEAGYPMHGSLERNWLLPSAVGALRPTCLAPETMVAGNLRRRESMLVVGIEELPDFYPNLVAGNLSAQGIPARDISLNLSGLHQRRFVTTKILAQLFDQPDFRAGVVAALKPRLEGATRVGFPAVLGLNRPLEVKRDLEEQIGCQVFEIPTLPPSVPGIRLHNLLLGAIKRNGGRIFDGMEVVAADAGNGRVTAVWTEAAARRLSHRATTFVLATGGILGGGITADHEGQVREVVFGLPLSAPLDRSEWFRRGFLDPSGHPIYQTGLAVNAALQPVDEEGQILYQNLHAVGTTLAHCEALRERSLEGIALVTGYLAGQKIA
jgi:glycerol-3-phosphate dehydrogenase subunit B